MEKNDVKRLSRLTAILTQLQTKRIITASELASKYSVSLRTIYRDIRSLESSGVPIFTEEGKGYSLMEGYRIPPVMFTEKEANALITAEKIILKNKDSSFVKEYVEAINKIRSVLKQNTKESTELLSQRMVVSDHQNPHHSSDYLSNLQLALTKFNLVKIHYQKPESTEISTRTVEPFALLSTQDNWLLVAWCRLRNNFRIFRLDRIKSLNVLNEDFKPHPISLQEYFRTCDYNDLQ